MKSVNIKVCNSFEAEADKALLEANGIRAEIIPYGESAFRAIAGGVGTVGILVRDIDAQAALELLGNLPQESASVSLADLNELVLGELANNKSQEQIAKQLVERGWAEAAAESFVQERNRQPGVRLGGQKEGSKIYFNQMVRGLFKIAGGIALTAVTYWLSRQGIGIYVVFLGLFVWGVVDFVVGLSGWFKHRG